MGREQGFITSQMAFFLDGFVQKEDQIWNTKGILKSARKTLTKSKMIPERIDIFRI